MFPICDLPLHGRTISHNWCTDLWRFHWNNTMDPPNCCIIVNYLPFCLVWNFKTSIKKELDFGDSEFLELGVTCFIVFMTIISIAICILQFLKIHLHNWTTPLVTFHKEKNKLSLKGSEQFKIKRWTKNLSLFPF